MPSDFKIQYAHMYTIYAVFTMCLWYGTHTHRHIGMHIHIHTHKKERGKEGEKALKPLLFFTERKASKRIQYLLASNDKNVYREDKNSTVIGTFQKSFIPGDKIFIILDTVVNVHGTQQTARYSSCLRKLIVQQQAAFGSDSLETVANYTPQGK